MTPLQYPERTATHVVELPDRLRDFVREPRGGPAAFVCGDAGVECVVAGPLLAARVSTETMSRESRYLEHELEPAALEMAQARIAPLARVPHTRRREGECLRQRDAARRPGAVGKGDPQGLVPKKGGEVPDLAGFLAMQAVYDHALRDDDPRDVVVGQEAVEVELGLGASSVREAD